ncbi:MAG: hypothetical protein WD971_03450 [Pirellulales bacterium]
MFPNSKILLACAVVCAAGRAAAHDLPISGMQVVADEQYLHVELMLNSGELIFVRELDRNKDGRLEVAEVNEQGDEVARRIVDCLTLQTGGRKIEPDVVGVVPDVSTHHLTVRAHYPIDARRIPISVESRLWEITRGAHSTQVTFRALENSQVARLDARSPRVTFNESQEPELSQGLQTGSPSAAKFFSYGGAPLGISVAVAALVGGYFIFLQTHKPRN